ncbi:dipeptide ABC transporter ATP-binding protein [Pseudahrensia aquimaris]|uniref:Dipeptide ABC transporter ATP-binding protein n=1 Tax=Pseudahrensia aquimaris TaxID=744461 RepID=A0ABW3FAS0_9HYPH
MIRIEDLHIAIDLKGGDLDVVRGASFRIPAGKTVALVGESGSGKSILSQAILGILPNVARIKSGSIYFREKREDAPLDIAKLADNSAERVALRGGKISIIFQEPMTSLSPLHTIGNQVKEALDLHRPSSEEEAKQTTIDMLDLVGFPNPTAAYSMYPMELSGGLRQRAMIAMALICHPALLIADEPTTALDVSMQAKILHLLKGLQSRLGMAVLLITHDLGVVANMADEVVVMYHGQIMEAGTVEDIFRNPQHGYLKALLNAVPDLSMAYDEKLQSLRDIKHEIPDSMRGEVEIRKGRSDHTLLSVRGLRKTFVTKKQGWFGKGKEEFVAVDDVNFDVRQGECFGLVGESGCGKTTTLKMLVRALTPTDGTITWDGHEGQTDVLALQGSALKAFRRKIQMVFQDPFSSLSPRSTVLNILREPMEVHAMGTGHEQSQYAAELMRLVGLDPAFLGRYPHSFSGGQRQRIGIARALALRPDLLVCDEPVSALDVSVQAQVLNLLQQLQRELGLTYIFISHNLAVVRYIADRIGVMFNGQLVEVATRQELFDNPVHPYTRALLDVVPHADLDHPLDFDRINREMEGEGRVWPHPFTVTPDAPMTMLKITPNHRVRVQEGTQAEALLRGM